MRKELVIKFQQTNSEGFILLPSAAGLVVCREKLTRDKIRFEETTITFAGKQVAGLKFTCEGFAPKFYHRESFWNRNEDHHYMWYGPDDMGKRIDFRLPLYVELPDLPTPQ